MARKGEVKPNEFTFSSVVNVCSRPTAASDQWRQFHAIAIKFQCQDAICVNSSLLKMYSEKGIIENAQRVSDRQSERDLVTWNSMVSGYAQHGYRNKALETFKEMVARVLKLDGIKFIGVIVACTHTGRVEKGRKFFDSMVKDHGISLRMVLALVGITGEFRTQILYSLIEF